jgi:hypothetical protein
VRLARLRLAAKQIHIQVDSALDPMRAPDIVRPVSGRESAFVHITGAGVGPMRRLWGGLSWLLATLLGVAGCGTKEVTLRPPKHPEEITVPPQQDDKFSNPPEYPKESLNQDEGRKSSGPNGLNSMPNAGGRGGMGGGGMGGGMGGGGMGGRPY